MALQGIHFAIARVGAFLNRLHPFEEDKRLGTTLPYNTVMSATMESPGIMSAPDYFFVSFRASPLWLLSISASAPIFYAIGPSPDAARDPRRYMDPRFGREDIFIKYGDKIAWTFA